MPTIVGLGSLFAVMTHSNVRRQAVHLTALEDDLDEAAGGVRRYMGWEGFLGAWKPIGFESDAGSPMGERYGTYALSAGTLVFIVALLFGAIGLFQFFLEMFATSVAERPEFTGILLIFFTVGYVVLHSAAVVAAWRIWRRSSGLMTDLYADILKWRKGAPDIPAGQEQ